MVLLPEPTPGERKSHLLIEGEALAVNVPFRLKIVVNRKVGKSYSIKRAGPVQLRLDFPPSFGCDDSFHVEMKCSRIFIPSRLNGGPDSRKLAILLKRICVEV